ncbi:MAG TPA: SDR family oxidoreductase, partial [Symbiobacteriaceae bacterium]|nr:SDR family oxidoreductase [Symbiobacteriaceae bacterium]
LRLGYTQSKWVAEQLLLQAQERGIPTAIYRIGRVAGHTETGACQTDDYLWRLTQSCLEAGSMPELNLGISVVPADVVSGAIVRLSRRADAHGRVFHVGTPQPLPLGNVTSWLRDHGYPVEALPYDEWFKRVTALGQTSGAYALLPLVRGAAEGGALRFDCSTTLAMLEEAGLTCPVVDDRLMSTYFRYFTEVGWLPAPPVRA